VKTIGGTWKFGGSSFNFSSGSRALLAHVGMMGDDERSIDDQLGAAGEELVGSSNVAEDDGGRSVASDDDL